MRPTICLAEKMGERLGSGKILQRCVPKGGLFVQKGLKT